MSSFKLSTALGRVSAAAAAVPRSGDRLCAGNSASRPPRPVAATPVPDKGDTAFMFISTILVLFMLVPGLALFYGGLVRAKNMLSVLMQCTVIGAVVMLDLGGLRLFASPSAARTSAYCGGTAEALPVWRDRGFDGGDLLRRCRHPGIHLHDVPDDLCGDYTRPDRRRLCRAHQVLGRHPVSPSCGSPSSTSRSPTWSGTANGLLFNMGALDFAGGTVVHINAGIAGLVGAIMVGKRTGFGKDMMAPHSMTLTMVGASMLWVGWFGFNAGSNLEASGGAMLATVNTFIATAAAIVCLVAG